MWGEGEENDCGAQLVGKKTENDVVSSPHGSLIQTETVRKSVEQQAIKKMDAEHEQRGQGGKGRYFRLTRGRVRSTKNKKKKNSDSLLECTGTEKQNTNSEF
jgi:hypothetical protein